MKANFGPDDADGYGLRLMAEISNARSSASTAARVPAE